MMALMLLTQEDLLRRSSVIARRLRPIIFYLIDYSNHFRINES